MDMESETKLGTPITESSGVVTDTFRPLASVQRVHSPMPIEGRDLIVLATVQGYRVVVKKSEFFEGEGGKEREREVSQSQSQLPLPSRPNSLCVFFQVDSVLDPTNDEFKFLDSKRGRVVTTKKMYGVYSQGLCVPLDTVRNYGLDPKSLTEHQDLTEALKVTKYVTPEEFKSQYRSSAGNPFPTHLIPKTDEYNLQSYLTFLNRIKGRRVSITLKMDGSSMTVTHDGKLCGRNFEWVNRNPTNEAYHRANEKYQITTKLAGTNLSVQGELIGPNIQKNPAGVKDIEWLVFNVWRGDNSEPSSSELSSGRRSESSDLSGHYLPHSEVMRICHQFGFTSVPVLEEDIEVSKLGLETVDDWLQYAEKQTYANGALAEGIVVKTADDVLPRISFKVISRVYLSKQK